jgi:polysaccharide biosynthesis/export protein
MNIAMKLKHSDRVAGLTARFSSRARRGGFLCVAALAVCTVLTGCKTAQFAEFVPAQEAAAKSDTLVLREGDTVRITFMGAPNLNTAQQIRRDGRITLPIVGEFKAAGLTAPEMEKQLIELFGPQLQTKEVMVALESSVFPIYVTGAVLRPGKIMSDRPLTALAAIMEAGGFDYSRANTKAIKVIRNQDGRTEHISLNLKRVLDGEDSDTFNLKPSDILYVKERFNWF